jgi:hypothetical protein
MTLSKTTRREIEVAFSKHAQPIWFRIVKYLVLTCLIYFLWGTRLLWIILGSMLMIGLSLHLWYRYKTRGWTQSYGAWDYEKNKSKLK